MYEVTVNFKDGTSDWYMLETEDINEVIFWLKKDDQDSPIENVKIEVLAAPPMVGYKLDLGDRSGI